MQPSDASWSLVHYINIPMTFDDFPKNSEYFPKISQDSSKVVRKAGLSRRFSKITEEIRGLTDVSIIKPNI